MHKVNILQLVNSLEIGGAETVAVNLAININQKEFKAMVCTIEDLGPLALKLKEKNIKYLNLAKKPGMRITAALKLARIIRKYKIDIITTHNYGALFYGTIAKLLARRGSILHVDHNRVFPDKTKRWISEKTLSRFAFKVIAVSSELKTNLIQYEKINETHIDIITNGINGNEYSKKIDRARKIDELGLDNKVPILGMAVRLAEEKGICYFLEACEDLFRQGQVFQVIIAGDGPLKNELKEKTTSLNLDGYVKFLGERTDVNEILQVLDVYVLPSISEGMPLSLLEAMAASKAIVATNIGGIPEVIENEVSGLLVNSKSPSGLSEAIGRLINDVGLRENLGSYAKKCFDEKYSIETMMSSYEAYYREIKV